MRALRFFGVAVLGAVAAIAIADQPAIGQIAGLIVGGPNVLVPAAEIARALQLPAVAQIRSLALRCKRGVECSATEQFSNPNQAAIVVSAISVTPPFSITDNTCGNQPGPTCTVTVTLDATTDGTFTGALNFVTINAGTTTVPVTADVGADVVVSTQQLTFNTPAGTVSTPQTFTITNPTNQDLSYTYTLPAPNFSFVVNSSNATTGTIFVPAGATVTVSVEFLTAGDTAPAVDTATISLSLPGTPPLAAVALTGNVISADACVSPLLGNAFAGSIQGSLTVGTVLVPFAGAATLSIDSSSNVTYEVRAFTSTAGTQTSPSPALGSTFGFHTADGGCAVRITLPEVADFFSPTIELTQAQQLLMIEENIRSSTTFWNALGNNDASSLWSLSRQDPSVASSFLSGPKTFSLSGSGAYGGPVLIPSATLAMPTLSSGAGSAFLNQNIGGNSTFSTGAFSINQLDNLGQGAAQFNFNAGSFGLQSDSGIAVGVNPGNSLLVLNDPASASVAISEFSTPAALTSGNRVFTFFQRPTATSTKTARWSQFAGTFGPTGVAGQMIEYDDATGRFFVSVVSAPIAPSSLPNSFFVTLNGDSLQCSREVGLSALGEDRCLNINTGSLPASDVTTGGSVPQGTGAITAGTLAGSYEMAIEFRPGSSIGPIYLSRLTLTSDGGLSGTGWMRDPSTGRLSEVPVNGTFSVTSLSTFEGTLFGFPTGALNLTGFPTLSGVGMILIDSDNPGRSFKFIRS